MDEIEQQELVNTLPDRKGINYAPIPDGVHVCGLQVIKNIKQKKFQSEELVDGFRFVFRCRDIPSGFVNLSTSAAMGERSKLRKVLAALTGKTMPPFLGKDEAFSMMVALQGKWFNGLVKSTPWKKDPSVKFANAVIEGWFPHPDSDKMGNCRDYFKEQDEKAGIKVEKSEPSLFTGFEQYPNHEALAAEYPFFYDLTTVAPEKLKAAQNLCRLSLGKSMNASDTLWRTKNEVSPLAKYKKTTIEDDDVPF